MLLTTFAPKEVVEKDINWFAEIQITTIKIFKDPFAIKAFPPLIFQGFRTSRTYING